MKYLPALACLIVVAFSPVSAARTAAHKPGQCTTEPSDPEIETLSALIREWTVAGWHQDASGPKFDFRRQLGRFYDWDSPDVILFDNADPKARVNSSAAAYAAIWDAIVPSLRSLTNELTSVSKIIRCGDVAFVNVQFVSRFEMVDGSVKKAPTLSSLVWRKTARGWRIIREHGTAL